MMLRPMLAHTLIQKMWDNQDWVMEIKYDGIRCLWRDGTPYGRSGERWHYEFLLPLRELVPPKTTLDGELWVPGGVATDVLGRKHRNNIVYVAFDILEMDGHDLTTLPWETRREALMLLQPPVGGPMADRFMLGVVMEPSEVAYEKLISAGHEGVMFKRKSSPYVHHRSDSWLKLKATQEVDAVITDCDGEPSEGSYGSSHDWGVLSYGYYVNGELRRYGSVGHSAPREEQEKLIGKVAVIKHNGSRGGVLRHPRVIRYRDDKAAEECTLE